MMHLSGKYERVSSLVLCMCDWIERGVGYLYWFRGGGPETDGFERMTSWLLNFEWIWVDEGVLKAFGGSTVDCAGMALANLFSVSFILQMQCNCAVIFFV